MKFNHFITLTGVLFLIIGTLHLLRIIFNWSVVFNGWPLPLWPSIPALVVAYALGFTAFWINSKGA